MFSFVKIFEQQVAGKLGVPEHKVLHTYCQVHRLNLVVPSDTWIRHAFTRDCDRARRLAHGLFSHSVKRKSELARLKKAYNCVKSPLPLFQIRWLGRLNCVEALVDCRKAVVAYLREITPCGYLSTSTEEGWLVNFLESNEEKLFDILKVLSVVSQFTLKLQTRNLDMCSSHEALGDTLHALQKQENSLQEDIRELSKALRAHMRERFPVDESIWLSLIRLKIAEYSEEVCRQKILKLSRNSYFLRDLQAECFMKDFYRFQNRLSHEHSLGVNIKTLNVKDLVQNIEPQKSFLSYFSATQAMFATSVESERTFSILSRVKSTFLRNLKSHLPCMIRISAS